MGKYDHTPQRPEPNIRLSYWEAEEGLKALEAGHGKTGQARSHRSNNALKPMQLGTSGIYVDPEGSAQDEVCF